MSILTRPYMVARKNNGVKFEPDANTVLWLPGQDDAYSSTIRDRSGNGNNGTITGAVWKRTGQGLWYLDFEGDDYVNCGNDTSLRVAEGDHSILFWVNITSLVATQGIVTNNEENSKISDYAVWITGSSLTYLRGDDADATENIPMNPAPPTSTWIQCLVVVEGTDCQWYMNGATRGNGTLSNTPFSDTNARVWGMIKITGNRFPFTGGMTLQRIFNSALSAEQAVGSFNQERHLLGV